ncbi:MAG: IclR family transcriptional regulator, partial [Nocardioidaceae bacterium]
MPRHTASVQGSDPDAAASGHVQSVGRAFELLEAIADHGGIMSLTQMAETCGLPLPTIHRLLRTLVDLGYLRQQPSREYALGPRLIRLGESSGLLVGSWARPYLASLVDELGETANLAMLDGNQIVYVAQVPSRHAMRMFTEVGKRVPPHCTAVGKALLSSLPDEQVEAILLHTGMEAHTDRTIVDHAILVEQLEEARRSGYTTDEGEKEIGVRCVAVPVLGAPGRIAMSVSGPAPRMSDSLVERAVPLLLSTAKALA